MNPNNYLTISVISHNPDFSLGRKYISTTLQWMDLGRGGGRNRGALFISLSKHYLSIIHHFGRIRLSIHPCSYYYPPPHTNQNPVPNPTHSCLAGTFSAVAVTLVFFFFVCLVPRYIAPSQHTERSFIRFRGGGGEAD